MTRRWLKRLGWALGGTMAAATIAVAAVYELSEARFTRQYVVSHAAPSFPRPDSALVARGAHLVRSYGGCVECHGDNLAGRMIIDDPAIGTVWGANLTRGAGGVGGSRSDADLERAIRHGIGHDGRPLKVMPSTDYAGMTDGDLAAIVAYLRSVPPVDAARSAPRVGPVARALFVAGRMPILHAERIDHGVVPGPVAAGVTPAYGSYLAAVGCKGCHGPQLAGGPIAGAPPDWVPAANLTPAGSLARWTEADFARVLRTGLRPGGVPVNPLMPVHLTRNLTDDEVRAIWLYLRSIPAVPTGGVQQTASR